MLLGEAPEDISSPGTSAASSSGPPSLASRTPSSPGSPPSGAEDADELRQGVEDGDEHRQGSEIIILIQECVELLRNLSLEQNEILRLNAIDVNVFK